VRFYETKAQKIADLLVLSKFDTNTEIFALLIIITNGTQKPGGCCGVALQK
jgi:hypothetical protein